jgi:hypothetical protein
VHYLNRPANYICFNAKSAIAVSAWSINTVRNKLKNAFALPLSDTPILIFVFRTHSRLVYHRVFRRTSSKPFLTCWRAFVNKKDRRFRYCGEELHATLAY